MSSAKVLSLSTERMLWPNPEPMASPVKRSPSFFRRYTVPPLECPLTGMVSTVRPPPRSNVFVPAAKSL